MDDDEPLLIVRNGGGMSSPLPVGRGDWPVDDGRRLSIEPLLNPQNRLT